MIGIETIYANHEVLLIKKNDAVGIPEIFEALNEGRTLEIVPSGSDYLSSAEYFIAYTLENYNWIFGNLSGVNGRHITHNSLAREISRKLNIQTFHYHQSDGGEFVNYKIYENGFVTDFFDFCSGGVSEDIIDLANFSKQPNISNLLTLNEDDIQDYEGNVPFEYDCVLYSVSRQITVEDLIDDKYVSPGYIDPYYFVAKTIESLEIYIPISNPKLISKGKLLDPDTSNKGSADHIKCQSLTFMQVH
ncbi:hypothetical protein Lepto7375DRAFT_7893 [Leptolyngbya sp. PCC 7375]|nr:hypothetical protein Lepto7375DRAFT_7893 [Leptolyngbya sp. PCC 7375]